VTLVGAVLPDPAALFELLSAFRVLRENRSLNPALAIPYLGYARQDRATKPGEAAIGIMVAELLRNLNPSKLLVVDVHSLPIFEALGPHAVSVSALPLFADEMLDADEKVGVVVAPDAGAKARAQELAQLLTADVAVVEKVRPKPNVAQAKSMSGEVEGKHVLIIDDMIDTGGTIAEAVRLVSKHGALSIRVAATHGVFSQDARDRLTTLPIREILVTNTIQQPRHAKIRVLDITPMLT
jgi:ribose-phosphate pyrophosphokinase